MSLFSMPRPRLIALILLSLAQFIILFDITSVTLATVKIRDALHLSPAATPWVLSAYGLTFGGFLILGGRLGDLYGRKRLLLAGLLAFSICSLITAVVSDPLYFFTARAVKGLAAALIAPNAFSTISALFLEPKEKHQAFSIWWFIATFGAVVSMLISGAVANQSWRLALAMNVPFSLVLAYFIFRHVEENKLDKASRSFDYVGAGLVTLSCGLLIFTITNGLKLGVTSPLVLSLFAGAVISSIAFFILQRVHPAPLIPLEVFRNWHVIGGALFTFLWAASNAAFILNLFLQDVLHFTPRGAGLFGLPGSITGIIFSLLAIGLLNRFGAIRVLIAGVFLEALGGGTYVLLNASSSTVQVLIGSLILAIGLVLGGIAVKVPATLGIAPHQQGVVGGMLFAGQYLGSAFGPPIMGALLEAGKKSDGGSVITGYHWAFSATPVIIISGLIVALVLFRLPGPVPIRKEPAPGPKSRVEVEEVAEVIV